MYDLESFVELILAVFFSTIFLWNTFGYGEIRVLEELHSSCPQKPILCFMSSVHSFSVLTNNGKYRQIYGKILQYEIYKKLRHSSLNFNVNRQRNKIKNINMHFFLIFAPCILIYVQFTHQQMLFLI